MQLHNLTCLQVNSGLANDFSASTDSRTQSTELNSPRYPTLKLVTTNNTANSKRIDLDNWASVNSNLDRIKENSEENSTNTKLNSQPTKNMHNRGEKPTIFLLGCVFLELLAGLVAVERPFDGPSSQHPNEVPIFAKYIPILTLWARQ